MKWALGYHKYVQRDLYTSKETYVLQKRPVYLKRDPCTSKEINALQKRPTPPITCTFTGYIDIFFFLMGTAALYRVCSTGLR